MTQSWYGGVLSLLLLTQGACTGPQQSGPQQVEGYINKDTAQRMVRSYEQSLLHNPADKVQDVKYWVLDADLLRDYLANEQIRGVAVKLAHTLEYMNTGHEGQPAGYRNDALTIVINGFDSLGVVMFGPPNGTTVPDHAVPCPHNCPIVGP